MDPNEEEYGFFEDVDHENTIVSYSSENLPNYNHTLAKQTTDYLKKKCDSYDEGQENCLTYNYYDYARRIRINFLCCFQCCYPFIIVGSILSMFSWILCNY